MTKRGLGKSFTSYKRLLSPDYVDGIQEPKYSTYRRQSLPSPRLISSEIAKDIIAVDKDRTLALVKWAQFISHDLSHTVSNKMSEYDTYFKTLEDIKSKAFFIKILLGSLIYEILIYSSFSENN